MKNSTKGLAFGLGALACAGLLAAGPAFAGEAPVNTDKAAHPFTVTLTKTGPDGSPLSGTTFRVEPVQSSDGLWVTVGDSSTWLPALSAATAAYGPALTASGFVRSAELQALYDAYGAAPADPAAGFEAGYIQWRAAEIAEIHASGNAAAIAAVDAYFAAVDTAFADATEPITVTTDANGVAVFETLVQGGSARGTQPSWRITELEAPAGYQLADPFLLVTEAGYGPVTEDSPAVTITSQEVVAPGRTLVALTVVDERTAAPKPGPPVVSG